MLKNSLHALKLIVTLAITTLISSSAIARDTNSELAPSERCAIEKIKATHRAAKCLAHAQVKGIRNSLSEEEVNSIAAECETKHARAFTRAESSAQARSDQCPVHGNATRTHELLGTAVRSAAYGDTESDLNNQFNNGDTKAAYTSLSDAGVLLHQWDGSNETVPEWIPTPGHGGHSVFSISSSITNAKLRTKDGYTGVYTVHTQYPPHGGLIYSTQPVATDDVQIGCMGAGDIGSDSRLNSGCGCRNELVCEDYYNTDVFPKTPKSAVTIDSKSLLCQNSCGGNFIGNPDVLYWSKCDTNSSGSLDTFATGNCLALPLPSEGSDWYLSGARFQDASQLRAIMQSTNAQCIAASTGHCYNEVMARTTSFYQDVPAQSQTSQPQVGAPKSGAVIAFFYLNVTPGHYPATNPDSESGNWVNTDAGGQCDTYNRWKSFRQLYPSERTVLVEFDLSAAEDPFTTVCTDPDDDCEQKQIAAGCSTDE